MSLTPEQQAEFEAVSKPVIKWLCDNIHPHAIAIIECDGAQLFEGTLGIRCAEFIQD
jgi:hypothetical protein